MPQPSSNLLPQKGLVSTSPNPTVQTGINFNNSIKPLASPTLGANYGTSVPLSGIGGVSSTNPFIASPTGGTGGTTTPVMGSVGYGSGTLGQDQNAPGGTLKSPLIPIAGTPNTSTGTQGYVPVPTQSASSTYQQNLSKYGLQSIPQGYSFDASGKLTNGAGQEYAPSQPSTSQPNNTSGAGGGVSANQGSGTGGGSAPAGMMYDGQGNLVPISSINTPGNPNAATSSTFGNTVGTLAQTSSQPSAAFNQAQQTAQKALQDLNTSRQNEANSLALNSENPIPLEFQQGRGQIIQNQYLNQQDALSNEYSGAAALEGTATGQQSVQQQGLGSAATLVSPTLGSYGQAQYSPLGGTVGGGTGAGVSPSDPFYQTMQTYAQALASGQGTAIPSSITGNPALQAQLLNMAKQINPDFNYNQSTATGQSQQAQTGQAQQYQSAAKQAQNLGLQLNQVISSTGVNSSDINAANSALQKIASNTSDPNYATFNNLITDLANTYAQVLTPAGGAVTDQVRTISQSLLDSSMKGSGISQVIQNLDAQVQAKIAGTQTAYGNQSNTSGATPPGLF